MLRQEFSLTILLDIAQLPRATFYDHPKRMMRVDKVRVRQNGKSQQFITKTRDGMAIAASQWCSMIAICP